jgi:predicted nucleic acid-binding protein
MSKPKFIFDTNTFISAILLDGSVSAIALDKTFKIGEVVVSDATFSEFTQALFRGKFDNT